MQVQNPDQFKVGQIVEYIRSWRNVIHARITKIHPKKISIEVVYITRGDGLIFTTQFDKYCVYRESLLPYDGQQTTEELRNNDLVD